MDQGGPRLACWLTTQCAWRQRHPEGTPLISRVIRVDEVRICSILWVFVRCELEIFFNMSVVSGLPPTIYSLPCRSIKAGNGGDQDGDSLLGQAVCDSRVQQ